MQETYSHLPVEDMVLKTAAQYFADELFPFLGIRERATVTTPMEQVYLETKGFYESFNYVVGEGKWIHLEFKSDSVIARDLQRFRYYGAMASYTYHVSITAYVVYFSKVRNVLSQLESGISTYRITPIRLKDKDVDRLFQDVMEKKAQGRPLRRKDPAPLLFTTPIFGAMAQKDRIIQSSQLIQEGEQLNKEESAEMSSMLYALANRFLNDDDLKKVREVLFMTRSGQMLYNDEVADGMVRDLEKETETDARRVDQLTAHLLRDSCHAGLLRSLEDPDSQELLFKEYYL